MKSPYEILGVKEDATEKEIDKAYRRLSAKYHPDMHIDADKEENSKLFKEISAAYEKLKNPQRNDFIDAFSFNFESFFTPAMAVGKDIVVTIEIDIRDTLKDQEVEISYSKNKICPDCKTKKCDNCNGSGFTTSSFNNIAFRIPCKKCSGGCEILGKVCKKCDNGYISESIKQKINVPNGTYDKQWMVRGGGHQLRGGYPGNLRVIISVDTGVFQIDGINVHFVAEVEYHQLVLGDEITVSTIEGEAKLKVPPGTHVGQSLKLKGLGLPINNGKGGIYKRGDQIVHINLNVPKNIDESYRELMMKMKELKWKN